MPAHTVSPTTQPHVSLLRRVLQFDAFTGLGSIPLALASAVIAPLFGMPVGYLIVKFILFGLYGVWLFSALRREPIPKFVGWIAVSFNTLVTLESGVVLLLKMYPLTLLGRLFLVLQMLAGPILIAVQYIGTRRYY